MPAPFFAEDLSDTEKREISVNVIYSSTLTSSYIGMNALATIVASYGLIQNSAAVIIGAMLIAPLLGPIMGISLSLTYASPVLFKGALISEALAIFWAFLISFIVGVMRPDFAVTPEMLSRTAPNIMDMVIAFSGGLAGSYAILNKRLDAAVVGVAIATALVPPLATSGLLAAKGEYQLSMGSMILFITNFISILCASTIIFWANGFRYEKLEEKKWVWPTRLFFIALFMVMATYLTQTFTELLQRLKFESTFKTLVREEIQSLTDIQMINLVVNPGRAKNTIDATINTSKPLTPEFEKELTLKVKERYNRNLSLKIKTIHTYEVVANTEERTN